MGAGGGRGGGMVRNMVMGKSGETGLSILYSQLTAQRIVTIPGYYPDGAFFLQFCAFVYRNSHIYLVVVTVE